MSDSTDNDDPAEAWVDLDVELERRGKVRGPAEAAGVLMAERRFVQTAEGRFYEYDKGLGYWRPRTADFLRAAVHGIRPKFSSHLRDETIKFIGAARHDSDLEWGRVEPSEVAVANGVLDLETLALRPHDPDDWLDYVIPHAFEPGAEAPVWTAAVDAWLDIESPAAAALQEFFGYALLPHARFKRALVCYGESNTGKSRIPATLKCLVGAPAYCSISVVDMDDPRRLAHIMHKRVNGITELSADAMIRDGGFKTLVGTEEALMIDVKHGPILTYTPVCVHVIACNVLPLVTDRTSATFERLLIVPFVRKVAKADQDPGLDDKIAAEIAGVIAWAIEGARRLYLNDGVFTAVPEGDAIVAAELAESNPMHAFVAEELVEDPGSAVPLSLITERFNLRKVGKPTNARMVGIWLRSALGRESVKAVRFGERSAKALKGYRMHALRLGQHPPSEGWPM